MPNEAPAVPQPASGTERLTLAVEAVRATTSPSWVCAVYCFAEDDAAAPSSFASPILCFAEGAE